jgi:DNA-binding response OmpR family regulator
MASGTVILVVEDDPDMRETVCMALLRDGYRVQEAEDGRGMRAVLAQCHVDLVILDLVLPGESGFDLARELRNSSDIPLIMLTGKDNVIDKVVGLEIGADDYITKPFHARELVARIGTVLRRARSSTAKVEPDPGEASRSMIRFGDWQLDLFGQRLTRSSGDAVVLTTYEFQVLSALVQRPGKALSRDQIMDLIADRDWNPFDRSIDVLIGKIRKKLGDDSRNPDFIRTIRNIGYMFIADVERV